MKFVFAFIIFALTTIGAGAQTIPCSRTYTLDADFDEGILKGVNHDAPNNDQLQLNPIMQDKTPLPYIWVACSDRGTVVRIDVNTGEILGEYLTTPVGYSRNPSRTTVDLRGDGWVTNRDDVLIMGSTRYGSICKFGVVVGGTRCDDKGNPNPNGEYLKPPFQHCTAVDRNGDGLIRTSRGLGHILSWPNKTDGVGGVDGIVEDAQDECILLYQRLPNATATRHCSVDQDNNIWAAGYPGGMFHRLKNETAEILESKDFSTCNSQSGYGGLVDKNNVLWSANGLLRYDPATNTCTNIRINAYGTGMDPITGDIWCTVVGTSEVCKIAPDGTIYPGFPKYAGGKNPGGIVVTEEHHAWTANRATHDVSRISSTGDVLKVIPVGLKPTGVAVDANGKIWVTNWNSNNAMRIDPNGGADGLGAVDMTVDLGVGAGPYNYSDMTGAVATAAFAWSEGEWHITKESCMPNGTWGYFAWTADEPPGTSLTVLARIKDTGIWQDITAYNGISLCGTPLELRGQFVEARVLFSGNTTSQESPILYDFTIAQCSRLTCDLTAPDSIAPVLTQQGIDSTAFDVTVEVYNQGPMEYYYEKVVLVIPPAMGISPAPGTSLETPSGVLAPGERRQFVFSLIAGARPFTRDIQFEAVVYDTLGIVSTSCYRAVTVREVDASACYTEAPSPVLYYENTGRANPDEFDVRMMFENHYDTTISEVRCTIDTTRMRSLTLTGNQSLTRTSYFLGAGKKWPFSWHVAVRTPLQECTVDTIDFNYTLFGSQEPHFCRLIIPVLCVQDTNGISAQCAINAPDQLTIDGYGYTPNPFDLAYTITNKGSWQLDVAEVTIQLPASITTTDPLTQAASPVDPGQNHTSTWSLTAAASAFERNAVITVEAKDSEGNVLARCVHTVFLPAINGLSCATTSDTLRLNQEGNGYVPNPFLHGIILTNNLDSTMRDVEVEIDLSGAPNLELVQPQDNPQTAAAIAPQATEIFNWTIRALNAASGATETIVYRYRSLANSQWRECSATITLPPINGLECEAGDDVILVFDDILNGYKPNPFDNQIAVYNRLGTAQTNVEVEVSFSPPIIETEGMGSTQTIASIPAGNSSTFTWVFRLTQPVDTATVVTVTYRIRSDQYPEWRECSFQVTVPARSFAYCAECIADGIDTVWINRTNEIMIPSPYQVYTKVINTCTGILTNIECRAELPSNIAFAPGVSAVQTIPYLAPGDTGFAFWDMMMIPDHNDFAATVEIRVSANEWASAAVCNHTTVLVHRDEFPLALSRKLLYFQALQNDALPAAQDVMVYPGYPVQMPWTSQYPDWLDIQPDNGTDVAVSSVQPNTTALPIGRYWGTIAYNAALPNAPRPVDVIYDITDVLAADPSPAAADGLTLYPNYPNPFRGSTTVRYSTASSQTVHITVYNMLGVPVHTAMQQPDPGVNRLQIPGLSPGLYMLVISNNTGMKSRMMLAR